MRKFRSDSDGDYKYRNDAKTFSDEFYFINYIDNLINLILNSQKNWMIKNMH